LMTETIVLALAGGVIGVALGWWALRAASVLNLDQLPRGFEIEMDTASLAAMVALTFVVGLALGVAPVLRLWRINLNAELREESRGGTAGRRANVVRRVMAMAQVALTLVLLAGAALLMASFRAVTQADLGFQPAQVETATISLPTASFADANAMIAFEQRALTALRAMPGVESAGLTSLLPFSGNTNNSVLLAEGHTMQRGESLIAPLLGTATPGYFESLSARLASGRFFDARDTREAPKSAIVDDRLARAFWPGQDAVGRRIYFPDDPGDLTKVTANTQYFTVVGVIKEMQFLDPRGDFKPVGVAYFPFEQRTARNNLALVVKGRTATSMSRGIRSTIARVDPQLPVYRPRSMEEWIDRALVGRRVPMLIAVAFAAIALFLSSVGIYGVLAYGVTERRRELGVRLALGGSTGSIFRIVLIDGLKIVIIGLAVGLLGALFVGRMMKAELFQVTPTSPAVLIGVTVTMSAVAVLASIIPAWRASRIDPTVVLSR